MLTTKSLTSHTNSSKAVTYTCDANGSVELGYADGTVRGEAGENPASDVAVNGVGKAWFRTSALNSTLFAVDADGAVVAHMIYDPWGRALLETYTDANFSGLDNLNNFTGYAWDETLGLYFAQNRFYDAALHRFTQEDAIRDGGNWYAYCGNNPLVYVDVLGLSAEISLGSGWYYRIDPEVPGVNQRHIHVWNSQRSYAQNVDGSPHDKNNNDSGTPPRWVMKKIKKNTGWDYAANREDFFMQTKLTSTIKDDRVENTLEYIDGTIVVFYNDSYFIPALCSISEFEHYYYKGSETYVPGGLNENLTPVLPILEPVPMPIPVTPVVPIPIPAFPF